MRSPNPASCSLAALLAAALCTPAQAQLSLDKQGGAVPGSATFRLNGSGGQIYAVVLSTLEAQSEVLPGVFLDVALDQLNLTFTVPGLLGVLNGAGQANPVLAVPNNPALAGARVSAQALQGPLFDDVSNLVRVTLAAPGTFAETLGDPLLPIAGGAAAKLPNGRVLFAGGSGPAAQTYDSRIEEWELSGASFGVGFLSQSTALADGRILFTGGLDLLTGQPTNAAALYNPLDQTTIDLTMTAARAGHQATLLSNGRVMVTGGFGSLTTGGGTDILTILLNAFAGLLNSTEFFDPNTQAFSAGPNMLEPRAFHTSTALGNGDVLIAGGLTRLPIINIPAVSNTAYQYIPALQSFGLPKLFSGPRLLHTAVRIGDGSVLLAGGLALDLAAFLASGDLTQISLGALSDVQRYTTGLFGAFSSVGTLSEPRAGAAAVALPGNQALFLGGFRVILSSAQIDIGLSQGADRYTLGQGVTATGSLTAARLFPLALGLDDGTVLVAGGGPLTAEVYQP
jgi:hypothetical protein